MNASIARESFDESTMMVEGDLSQYLAFTLAGEMYCLPLDRVREIIQYREVAIVPMMPDCVRGVINLRGSVIPVVDLAARFGRKVHMPGKRSVILILEIMVDENRQTYGLIVDAVSEVLALSSAEIDRAPAFGTGLRTEFIAGVAKHQGAITLILDAGTLLALAD